MSLTDTIKETLGSVILKSEIRVHRRSAAYMNLEDAKNIGILFDSSRSEDFEELKKYVNQLKDQKKKVKVIGYFSDNKVPPTIYSKLEYDFFTRKDLNWYAKPINPFVDNFIAEENDILIDLNVYNRFPLKYIAAISKAKFKVGAYSDKQKDMYDMMININGTPDFKTLLTNINNYLVMVNKK